MAMVEEDLGLLDVAEELIFLYDLFSMIWKAIDGTRF
jgi:hypothetical protein